MRLHLAVGSLAAAALLVGADLPPREAKPLSEVLVAVEKAGLSPIVEASFDDGVWEVEGFRGKTPYEAHFDPKSLALLHEHADSPRERPAADSLSAVEVVKRLESAGYGPVLGIDYEGTDWEAEAMHGGRERELHVDLRTGEVLTDRADD